MVEGLDFNTALQMRLALLKGMSKVQLTEVWKKIEFNSGAYRCAHLLKELGFKTAVLSGGFTFFTDVIADLLNMDYAFANTLEFDEKDIFTGNTIGPIINGQMKEKITTLIAERENIPLQEVIATGDGANDRWMISKVGLGIAYHGKVLLKEATPHHLNFNPLDSILYFIPTISNLQSTIKDKKLQELLPTYTKNKNYTTSREFLLN